MVAKKDPKMQELFQKRPYDNPHTSIFYPNECFICKASNPLKRCSRCNMICYCGKQHQKEHWPEHKDICNIIFSILKEKHNSHIFEDYHGLDAENWQKIKNDWFYEIQMRLQRPLVEHEAQMIFFPRACFVCHDARQDLLKNCPGCPNASFCKKHPSHSLHDKDCSQMKKCHELDTVYNERISNSSLESVGIKFVEKTPIIKSKYQTLPSSMEEFLEYANVPMKSEIIKFYLTEYLRVPLTTFDAIQKLKIPSVSKLVIHVLNTSEDFDEAKAWEILFHLIPSLNQIKIIILGFKESNKLQEKLCEKCRSGKKKLSFQTFTHSCIEYAKTKEFEEPSLVFIGDVNPSEKDEMYQRIWKLNLMAVGMVNCPLLILTDTQENRQKIRQNLKDTFNEVLILYEGKTDFVDLRPKRRRQNEGISRGHDQIIIFKVIHAKELLTCNRCGITSRTVDSKNSRCAECESDLLSKDAVLFPPKNDNRSRNFFFINSCQVCHFRPDHHSHHCLIPCKHCRMVYYCDKDHQKEHWPEHKDLCRVILTIMEESGSSNIFEKQDKSSDLNWLKSKINLLLQAQTKLGRNLREYEREMFLFPRACLVCHESKNLERTCSCGLSICKVHKDSSEHKENCKFQSFSFLTDLEFLPLKQSPSPVSRAELLVFSSRKEIFRDISTVMKIVLTPPPSMQVLIDHFIEFESQKAWQQRNPDKLSNLRQMIYAEIFTRPLTLCHALRSIGLFENSIVVHVIGATDDEKSEAGYWEILLHFLPCLQSLKIVFVGPEVSTLQPVNVDLCDECLKCKKNLEVVGFDLRYDEYFKSESFVKPDAVVGFNLHMHESDYGITKDSWNETILTLKKVNAPFVITAKTIVKGITDCKKILAVLNDSSDYDTLKINCFKGYIWTRDYETEKIESTNQFVAFFHQFRKPGPIQVSNPFYNLRKMFKDMDFHMIPLATKEDSELETRKYLEPIIENSEAKEKKNDQDTCSKMERFIENLNLKSIPKPTAENSELEITDENSELM